LPPLLDLVRGEAKDENVVGTYVVADLDVGPVERSWIGLVPRQDSTEWTVD
jgi:hypothetical protein